MTWHGLTTKEEDAILSLAARAIPDCLYITDHENRVIFVNDAFCAVYGFRRHEILGQPCEILWGDVRSVGESAGRFRRTTATGWHNEFVDRRKDGSPLPVALTAATIMGADGAPKAIVRITRDISDRKRLEASLRRQAGVDGLTGLASRLQLDQTLDKEWRRAIRSRLPLSLIMLDVDLFKEFNDCFGHPAGDRCLQEVAAVARRTFQRAGDLVARYGGEELAIVLPGTARTEATVRAEALRRAVVALGVPHPTSHVAPVVTISLGVATAKPANTSGPELLVANADSALYSAKRSGRDRVRTYSGSEGAHRELVSPSAEVGSDLARCLRGLRDPHGVNSGYDSPSESEETPRRGDQRATS